MAWYTLPIILGGAGAAAYFTKGFGLLDNKAKPDAENARLAVQKFNRILSDNLANGDDRQLALVNNFQDPTTRAFLRSQEGLALMRQIYSGQLQSRGGDRMGDNDRNWLTTAAARPELNLGPQAYTFLNYVQASNGLGPVSNYGGGYSPYQGFGNFYSNSGYNSFFPNSGYDSQYQNNGSYNYASYNGYNNQYTGLTNNTGGQSVFNNGSQPYYGAF